MLYKHHFKRRVLSLGLPRLVRALWLFAGSLLFPHALLAHNTLPTFSSFTYAGYGTLGYSWLNDENAEYRTGEGISGATNRGSFKVDSRIALQFDGTFNSRFSSSLQVIARQDETGDPGAQLEWGFIRFLPTERVEIRAGRMSLPVFSLSDYREVGYANTLLRPPEDVYSQVPLRRFNGVDVTMESLVRGSLVTVQVIGGAAQEKIFNDLEPDIKRILGLSAWIERGPIRARINITSADIDVDSRSESIDVLRQSIDATLAQVPVLGDILDPVKSDFSGESEAMTFTSLGLSADFDAYFIDFEFASRRIDNWVGNVDSWSLVAGTRIGRFAPYAFVSANKDAQPDRRISLPDLPQLNELEAGINSFYAPTSQNTTGVGLRFDLSEKIVLKSQLELISREDIGISFIRSGDDGSDTGDDVVLFSTVVDFIF